MCNDVSERELPYADIRIRRIYFYLSWQSSRRKRAGLIQAVRRLGNDQKEKRNEYTNRTIAETGPLEKNGLVHHVVSGCAGGFVCQRLPDTGPGSFLPSTKNGLHGPSHDAD